MVADYLLIHESMEGADFAYICEHKQIPVKNDGTIEPAAKHVVMFEGVTTPPVQENGSFAEFLNDKKPEEPDKTE